jgi:hypothetical protein
MIHKQTMLASTFFFLRQRFLSFIFFDEYLPRKIGLGLPLLQSGL